MSLVFEGGRNTAGQASSGTQQTKDEVTLTSAAPQDEVPEEGVLLGFDYGTVRVGIAITTREQTIASPIQNYNRGSEKGDANFFRQLAEDYRAVGIVVGLPIHLSGDESQKSVESQNWGKWLSEVTGLPVAYYDERFTSSIAEDTLELAGVNRRKQKSRIDMIAAQIMLQMFVDNRRRQSSEEE